VGDGVVASVGDAGATVGIADGAGKVGTSVKVLGADEGLVVVQVARGAGVGVEVGSEVAHAVTIKTSDATKSRAIFFILFSS